MGVHFIFAQITDDLFSNRPLTWFRRVKPASILPSSHTFGKKSGGTLHLNPKGDPLHPLVTGFPCGTCISKMNFIGQGFRKFENYKETGIQTDKYDRMQYHDAFADDNKDVL